MPRSTTPRTARRQAAVVRRLFRLSPRIRRRIAGPPVCLDDQQLALDAQLLLRLSQRSADGLAELSPTAARADMRRITHLLDGWPLEGVQIREVTIPADHGTIPARLYQPDGLPPGSPLLVYYHGGGWVVGDLDSHDNLCRYLAATAAVRVLSVDYRLAPEHPFPAAVDDAMAAFRYAVTHAAALGADREAIAVGGDSAGGNLAAVTAHRAAQTGGPRPVFLLLFYPAVDAVTRRASRQLFADGFLLTEGVMRWSLDHYAPDPADHADPRLSVLHAEDLAGLPPTYLATAGFDPLRDEGEAFAQRLGALGVPVILRRQADLIHGYAGMLGLSPRFREAVAEAAGALRAGLALAKHLSSQPA